jgi:hypothetical protein
VVSWDIFDEEEEEEEVLLSVFKAETFLEELEAEDSFEIVEEELKKALKVENHFSEHEKKKRRS